MSEGGSPARTRRPETARPRVAPEDPLAPAADELEAMERHVASLPSYSGAEVRRDEELGVTLVSLPGHGPGLNYAAVVRWEAGSVRARQQALVRRMRAMGEWPAVLLADGISQPAGLAGELQRLGWAELERERILWTRHPPTVPHLDPTLRLEALTRRAAREYEALEREIFGLPATLSAQRTAQLGELVASGALRAFLVRLDRKPVAVTRLVALDGVAGIYGVGVAEGYRRRGLGTFVTAVATRAGLATGNRLVWLSVDERNGPALRTYTNLGFQPGFDWSRLLGPA